MGTNNWKQICQEILTATKQELFMRKKNKIYLDLSNNYNLCYKFILNNDKDIQIIENNEITDSLFVDAMTKNHFLLRSFSKKDFLKNDFYPFASLLISEILEISKIFCPHVSNLLETDLHSNVDLFHLSMKDVEWLCKEDEIKFIITSDTLPHKNYYWHGYTPQQQKIIGQMWMYEKQTRDKIQTPSILDIHINR